MCVCVWKTGNELVMITTFYELLYKHCPLLIQKKVRKVLTKQHGWRNKSTQKIWFISKKCRVSLFFCLIRYMSNVLSLYKILNEKKSKIKRIWNTKKIRTSTTFLIKNRINKWNWKNYFVCGIYGMLIVRKRQILVLTHWL